MAPNLTRATPTWPASPSWAVRLQAGRAAGPAPCGNHRVDGVGRPTFDSTQVSHKDLTETMAGIDSPGGSACRTRTRLRRKVATTSTKLPKSFYAPKTPKMPKKNGAPP